MKFVVMIAALITQTGEPTRSAGIIESSDPAKDQFMLISVPEHESIKPDSIIVTIGAMRIKNKRQYRIYLRNIPAPTKHGVQKLRLEHCKNVSWTLNGKPVKLGQVDYDFSRSSNGLMSERIVQHLNLEQLQSVGTAENLTYKLCGIEGNISPQDLGKAKVIADRFSDR